jgi:hypothetical protein
MFTSDQLSPGLQMWLDVILSYNFTIHHRPGYLNVLPDAISRMYTDKYAGKPWGIPSSIVFVDERNQAMEPTELQVSPLAINNQIAHNIDSSSDLHQQLLYEMERRGKIIPLIEEERKRLILEEHAKGHFGREAIYHALFQRNYWWPKMRDQIQSEVLRCNPCMRHVVRKSGFKPAEYITSNGPWSHIQLDCCLSFPEAFDGNKVLLVIIDHFTSFVLVFPLKDKSAKSVAEKLWWVCSIFGLPSVIQSDNGKEFCNTVVKELVSLMQVDFRFIAPYNPRCDGAVERAVGVVSMMLKKMLHGADIFWPLYCPIVQAFINSKVHTITKSTPFSLMFGRSFQFPNLPNSPIVANDESPSLDNQMQWLEFQSRINSVVYPEVSSTVQFNKSKMTRSIDKGHKLVTPDQFIEGSVVMLKDQRKINKRDPAYVGPYIIQKKLDNGNYILVDNDGEEVRRQVPPDQLKFVQNEVDPINSPIRDLTTMKTILNHRGDPGVRLEYLIQWKDGDQTWEPQSSLGDVYLIQKYWSKFQKNSKREKKLVDLIDQARSPPNNHSNILFPLNGGGVGEQDNSIIPHPNSFQPEQNQSAELKALDQFLIEFIKKERIRSPNFIAKFRKDRGLLQTLKTLLLTSGLNHSFAKVQKRLKQLLMHKSSAS